MELPTLIQSNPWIALLAVISFTVSFLVSFFGLFKGPADRGKRYPWKKDEDPAIPTDSSPLLVAIDKSK